MTSLILLGSLEQLSRVPPTGVNHLQHMDEFVRFAELLQKQHPQMGTGSWQRFTLATALRQLGLASLVGGVASDLAVPSYELLNRLDQALRGFPSKRRHLCPLDLASDLPALAFGPNQVRTFSSSELEDLFDVQGLRRVNRQWSVDTKRFAEFTWLVVDEDVSPETVAPGQRRLPSMFSAIDRDFGRIEPYHTGLPVSVEDALFGLLVLPWEEIVDYLEMDWRGFQIPWVYTVDFDVFARRSPVPSPDSLAWEPATQFDADGNEYEYERPISYPLHPGSEDKLAFANDATWQDIKAARKTVLFARPVAHFFIRGFQTSGIDEFLAHISAVESALGQPQDHHAQSRKRIDGKSPGATYRVTQRISGLLGDKTFGETYSRLFKLRSDFLHGKAMAAISGRDRTSARLLARKIVCELIGVAVNSTTIDREQLLDDLLEKGAQLR